MQDGEQLSPLETLYDASAGMDMPLPPGLARLYGTLRYPLREDGPHVIANLVSTVDGVVSLGVPGHAGGKDISGANKHDVAVMGLLRAVSDAVVVGAGTIRGGSGRALTPDEIYPPLSGAYAELRRALGKTAPPLTVIVTGSGDVDPGMPVFHEGAGAVVATTSSGVRKLRDLGLPESVPVIEAGGVDGEEVSARAVLDGLEHLRGGSIVLVEGGPHLLASFYKERCLDEQFLTLSPQMAGRDKSIRRLSLVEGAAFGPDDPIWGSLVSVRRAGSHLFLRYSFDK